MPTDPPVLFYAAADCHFPEEADGGAWKTLKAVRGDAVHAAGQLALLCARDRAALVLAGDLWDGPDPHPDATGQVYAAMRPVTDSGIPVYYVTGNHDRGRDWLAPLAHLGLAVHRLDGRTLRDPAGFSVAGLSYVPPAAFADAAAAVGPADVGVYHQQWAEWAGGGGRVSLRSLPGHRVAVCGDVHVHAAYIPPPGTGGPALCLSPGPLAPQSIVEFEPTRVFAVYADYTARSVALPGRAYRLAVVNTVRDAEAVMAAAAAMTPDPTLPEHLAVPVLAVRLVKPVPGLSEALQDLAGGGAFVLRLVDAASAPAGPGPAPAAAVSRAGTDALAAVVARWPTADAETRALAAAVTTDGADPDLVLAEARAAFEAQQTQAGGVR